MGGLVRSGLCRYYMREGFLRGFLGICRELMRSGLCRNVWNELMKCIMGGDF